MLSTILKAVAFISCIVLVECLIALVLFTLQRRASPFDYDYEHPNPRTFAIGSRPSTIGHEIVDHKSFPHIYAAIRANAPFSVELAFRAVFRTATQEDPLRQAPLVWPYRILLSRPAGPGSVDKPPELSGPRGELVLPRHSTNYHHRLHNYAEFSQQLSEHSHRLTHVRVLDIVDDMGRQGARPVLPILASRGKPMLGLDAIRFIPHRLPFTTRTWQIDVPKVVIFMKLPLPPPGSAPRHHFVTWSNMLRISQPSVVHTLVINVRFLDKDSPITATYDNERYIKSKYIRPNVVLVFTDATISRTKSEPNSNTNVPLAQRQARFDGIVAAIALFRGGRRMHSADCKSVTVVGIDEMDPTMFGLAGNAVPSQEIHKALHQKNLGHHCCKPNITCQRVGCTHSLKFYQIAQYKAVTSSEEFAVNTVWSE